MLAHWSVTPVPDTLVLAAIYYPLCSAVALLIFSVISIISTNGALLRWILGIWISVIGVLAILLLLIYFVWAHPGIGYWGMSLSCFLSGTGILLLRSARPALRRA
jgi:hypothetical protein